jgi:hypothetical protein
MSLPNDAIAALPAVEGELNYLAPLDGRPWNYTYPPPEGVPISRGEPEAHRVAIRSLRPVLSEISLDGEGFDLIAHKSALTHFDDEDEIRRTYYPEAEQILKDLTGAHRVVVFDHTIRRRVPGMSDRTNPLRQPVQRVHVDHTIKSGPQRVRDLLGDEAGELLKGRVQVINLWRPIRGPVLDMPLAFADAQSVAPQDLVGSDLIYRDRVGETYSVAYNPAHRWFYVPEMRTDEALLLKCYDSRTDGRARFAPHTAFTDPTTPADAPPRQSIELRTFVFHNA